MRRFLLLALSALSVVSCGSIYSRSTLYYWGGSEGTATAYEARFYEAYGKSQTPESLCDLLCLYEKMVSHPGGERQTVPPGICAEYGYLLLQAETPATFAAHATDAQKRVFGRDAAYGDLFREKGAAMMEMEMTLYPESAVYLKPLLKKLAGR